MMIKAITAELYGVYHRRGFLVCLAIWVLQIVLFAYTVNYIVSQTVKDLPAAQLAATNASILPQSAVTQVAASLPMYGAPIMIIIGALLAAGDDKTGMLRTILAKFPQRGRLLSARFVVLMIIVAITILVSIVAAFICSLIIAGVSGSEIVLPSPGSTLRNTGFALLIGHAWAVFGFTLGVLSRNLAVAIGGGLLWSLIAEQALHGLGSSVQQLTPLRSILISGASTVLANGSGGSSLPGGVPPNTSAAIAIAILAAWIIVGAALSFTVFSKRDF